jgi:hypothetical protein
VTPQLRASVTIIIAIFIKTGHRSNCHFYMVVMQQVLSTLEIIITKVSRVDFYFSGRRPFVQPYFKAVRHYVVHDRLCKCPFNFRLLNVDNTGHMIMKCCNKDNNVEEEVGNFPRVLRHSVNVSFCQPDILPTVNLDDAEVGERM